MPLTRDARTLRNFAALTQSIGNLGAILSDGPDRASVRDALTLCLHNSMNLRYEVEFASPLVWLAVVGILGVEGALAGRPVRLRVARWGWSLLLAFSVAFNLLAIFEPRGAATYNLGVAALQKGHFDDAIVEFQKTLRINPAHSDACNNLGTMLSNIQAILERAPSHWAVGGALADQRCRAVADLQMGDDRPPALAHSVRFRTRHIQFLGDGAFGEQLMGEQDALSADSGQKDF